MNNLKQQLKEYRRKGYFDWLIVGMLAVLFFIGTSLYNVQTQTKDFVKWSSPDETANYIFSKLYAEEGRLEIAERYNILIHDIMHPRSFQVRDGVLRPMSFLGLVLLYGQLAHFFGAGVLPYLTPFFGAMGLVFFYLLTKELFYRRVALIASVLLATFPVYVYFSSKSMFHNILFLVLTISGFYFLVIAAKRNKLPDKTRLDWLQLVYLLLGGGALGWSLVTRSSELIWLGPVYLIVWLGNWRQIRLWQVTVSVLAGLIALLPMAYYNQLLYGSYFSLGYAEANSSLSALSADGQSLISNLLATKFSDLKTIFEHVFKTFFYFGFHPLKALKLFMTYSLELFAWLPIGFVFGLLFWFLDFKKIKRGQVVALSSLAILAAILIAYYGSWDFHDNPDKTAITIGNSYTRYWLPIYAIMIIWSAFAIELMAKNLTSKRYSWLIASALTIWIALVSIKFVWLGSDEALKALIIKSQITRQQWDLVLNITEPNAVIITKYQDKLFFPERKVIYGLFDDDAMIREYAKIVKRLPTYYYSFSFSEKDVKYLNERRLLPMRLKLEPLQSYNDFTLYRLSAY